MRDARPFLQIVHVGAWDVATPEELAARRANRLKSPTQNAHITPRHDPTAVLALRRWLEAVTLKDPTGRRLVTWLVETGARTAFGDAKSLALSQRLARELAVGTTAARVIVPAPSDLAGGNEAHFGARHPSAPLTLRAPHGAWEVQLFAQDTARDAHTTGLVRTTALRAEHRPGDEVPVLVVGAGHSHPDALLRTGMDSAWVCSTLGDAQSVPSTVSATRRAPDEDPEGPLAQSVALLRVYASPSQKRSAIIERLRFSRPLAAGPFRLVPSETCERLLSWA